MAVETVTRLTCDAHGTACSDTVETYRYESPVTGDPLQIELCSPEWERYQEAQRLLTRLARVDRERVQEREEKLKDQLDAVFRRGVEHGESRAEINLRAGDEKHKPLLDAAREWYRRKEGRLPPGKATLNSSFVKHFLASSEGQPWKEWNPDTDPPTSKVEELEVSLLPAFSAA
jgi:hypothetical protein